MDDHITDTVCYINRRFITCPPSVARENTVCYLVGLPLITNCDSFRCDDSNAFTTIMLKIVCGALIAFCMEVAEVMVVTYTSCLTLSIAGIFKVRNNHLSINKPFKS